MAEALREVAEQLAAEPRRPPRPAGRGRWRSRARARTAPRPRRPARPSASASTSQNVQSRKVPSLAGQAVVARRPVAADQPVRRSARPDPLDRREHARVGRPARKPTRGIASAPASSASAAERLHERAELASFSRRVRIARADLVARPPSSASSRRSRPIAVGEPDAAVERDPAHQPCEYRNWLRPAAHLPDAVGRLLPVAATALGDARRRTAPAARRRDRRRAVIARSGSAASQQLAVDVELDLVGRAVADPHRPRAAVALEVVSVSLPAARVAVDAVQDLQDPGRARRRRAVSQREEVERLVVVADASAARRGSARCRAARCSGSPSCARRRSPRAARSSARPRSRRSARRSAA